MDQKLITLNGGKLVTVKFEPVADAAAEGGFRQPVDAVWTVRQIPLREYQAILGLMADEFALTARVCGKTKTEVQQLMPESYETLQTAVREVNEKGFFTWYARQQRRGTEELMSFIDAGMAPENVLAMFQTVARMPSPPPSLTVPPPPA